MTRPFIIQEQSKPAKMMTMFNYTTSYAKSTFHCGLGQNLEKNIWCEIVSLIDIHIGLDLYRWLFLLSI